MFQQYACVAALAAALAVSGCSHAAPDDHAGTWPAAHALELPPDMTRATAPTRPSAVQNATLDQPGTLTLSQALARTLLLNPDLAKYAYETRSADALILQAGYRPNPEVFLGTEDVGRTNNRAGQTAQTTLTFTQVVELGGKRAARVGAARASSDLVSWDYKAARLDVLAQVSKRFVEVVAAQDKRALAADMLKVERQFFQTVQARVVAGDVPSLERERAQVELSNSQIALDQADRDLTEARVRLAALWASKEPRFTEARGDLQEGVQTPPSLQAALLSIERNPDLARWTAEIQRRQAQLEVERSRNVPDLTLQAGPRAYSPGGSSFVAGVGITLPTFGLNGGNVLSAQAQLDKGYVEQAASEVQIISMLRQAHARLSTAYANIQTLKREVLPAAQTSFDGVLTGYRQGKFGLLDVLSARRALFDARGRFVDSLTEYQQALTDVQRLSGQASPDDDQPAAPSLRSQKP